MSVEWQLRRLLHAGRDSLNSRPCPQQAGVHPEQAANTVERPAFERIWRHSVDLLRRGFQSGSILTVDPEEAQRLGKPWTRRHALCYVPSQSDTLVFVTKTALSGVPVSLSCA